MKLYSWNVNGIRAVLSKGALQSFITEHDPDILCLQETKAERGQFEIDFPQYHEHFFSAAKKGYSGTAIFSKVKPIRYIDGFPEKIISEYGVTGDTYGDPNKEGRVIAAEFDGYWVVTCYTPNSKGDLSRLKLRYDSWDRAMLAYLKMLEDGSLKLETGDATIEHGLDGAQGATQLRATQALRLSGEQGEAEDRTEAYRRYVEGEPEDSTQLSAKSNSAVASSARQQGIAAQQVGKPVLYCGDMNVAHSEIDLANPKANIGKHGFTSEERERFQDYLDAGFVDTFRAAHPDKADAYTWWTHWANARARNVGWRIDYWLASSSIASRIKNPAIHPEVMGSDHCPVSIEIPRS